MTLVLSGLADCGGVEGLTMVMLLGIADESDVIPPG